MEYNKYLVFCDKCGIPETIPRLSGNKKNPKLEFSCSACKNITEPKIANKRIAKGIDIITKYLKDGNEWKINKGTCILQSENDTTIDDDVDVIDDEEKIVDNLGQLSAEEESNPFDFL
jgi:hypothetical protein